MTIGSLPCLFRRAAQISRQPKNRRYTIPRALARGMRAPPSRVNGATVTASTSVKRWSMSNLRSPSAASTTLQGNSPRLVSTLILNERSIVEHGIIRRSSGTAEGSCGVRISKCRSLGMWGRRRRSAAAGVPSRPEARRYLQIYTAGRATRLCPRPAENSPRSSRDPVYPAPNTGGMSHGRGFMAFDWQSTDTCHGISQALAISLCPIVIACRGCSGSRYYI
ncbi:hypothetical protein C8R46DRAFT_1128203 [Mycena filopes]|nr:hypothetical protein C8R46DRAFT_1128203 [Mycena filopes]